MSEYVRDKLSAIIWPGAAVTVDMAPYTQVDEEVSFLYQGQVVTRATFTHPDTPIVITYTYDIESQEANITLDKLHEVGNIDIQRVLPVVKALRVGRDLEKPTRWDYDTRYQLIEDGLSYNEARVEFTTTTSGSSDAFYHGIYRRKGKEEAD